MTTKQKWSKLASTLKGHTPDKKVIEHRWRAWKAGDYDPTTGVYSKGSDRWAR